MRWNEREATLLSNDVIQLIALTAGGHLAEFRFVKQNGHPSQNVLWEAPWVTADPGDGTLEKLSFRYGPPEIGRFLAGYTGHALCLDYFGAPSRDEAAAGLSLHGEAAAAHWNVTPTIGTKGTACEWNVQLPVARLGFTRQIRLGDQESVAYIEETVINQRGVDHACHWVQHATFGPPFLNAAESTLAVSAERGMTSPFGYEGSSLLASDREFSWPHAPLEDGGGFADLRQPFSMKGRGFIAAIQLEIKRKVQYVLAVNWKLRLGVGYCFRRDDFPWMTIWEENCARQNPPWNGNVQARGMEFGTTPLALGREETLARGPIWDEPTWCVIPANGTRTARYLMFLFTLPAGMNSLQNVEIQGDAIALYDKDRNSPILIPAYGCEEFLSADERD